MTVVVFDILYRGTHHSGKVTWTGGKPEEPEWVSNHYGSFEVKDGLSDGLEVWFRGDGSPFQTQNYKKGKFHGESIWYKQYSSDQWVEDGTVGDVDIRGFYIEGDPVGGTVEFLHSDGTVEIKKHDEIFSDVQPCDPTES